MESPDDKYQYLLFAADPYETIAFKVPNLEIDYSEGKYFDAWDKDKKKYTLQVFFKDKKINMAPKKKWASLLLIN